MDTTNLLLIVLLVIVIYLAAMLSQRGSKSNVVYMPGPLFSWWGQGPTWRGPRPGRHRYRRRFWW